MLKLARRDTHRYTSIFFLVFLFFGCAAAAIALVAPTITNAGDTFSSPQTITLSAPAGSLFYTLNGAPANSGSTPYSGPFNLFGNCIIHAVAFSYPSLSDQTIANIEVDPNLSAPIYWLSSSLGVTTSNGSPGTVISWMDQSGSATSATGASFTSPILNLNAINALPSVAFNGSEFLTLPSAFSGFTNPSTGMTIFIVTKPTALTPSACLLGIGDGSSHYDISVQISSGATPYAMCSVYDGTSLASVNSSPNVLNANQYQLVEAELSPTGGTTVFINGLSGTTNSAMNTFPIQVRHSNFVGQITSGGNFYQGAMSEIIIYPLLTASQRTAAEAWLIRKFQIPVQTQLGPVITVPGGQLTQPTQVTIKSPPGTATYYTLTSGTSGITPTRTSPAYTGTPIVINYSQILEVICVKNGVQVGATATANYVLDTSLWPVPSSGDTSTPVITPLLPAPNNP